MPYKVEKGHGCPPSRPWACFNETNGHVHGCHASREDGLKQAAALYAAEDGGEMKNSTPDPTFAVGDRVRVVGEPHEPEQANASGVVAAVGGTAYGIRFDDMPDEVHKWYVGRELAPEKAGRSSEPNEETEWRAAMTSPLASHHVVFLNNMLRNHSDAVRATHDHIAAYEDSTTALPGLTEAIVTANEGVIGKIQAIKATGSGGGTTTTTTSSGSGSKGQGQGQGGGGRSSRELVESVMRDLRGQAKPNDDLGDAEFLYGFTAQLRDVQEALGERSSDNDDVKAFLKTVADANAQHIAEARKLAWRLSGGKTATRSSIVVDEPKPTVLAVSLQDRVTAERELLESVLYGDRASNGKKPYGNVSYADPGYQKDKKKRYPIDTSEHIHAAWSYINQSDNAAKYTSEQVAAIKGRIKAAAKRIGMKISSESKSAGRLEIDVVRFVDLIPEFRDNRHGDVLGILRGHFSVFDNWYPVASKWEGEFLERMERSAFDDTIREDRDQMRVLFDHGFDPSIGNKVLGPIQELKPDDRGAYYEVELLDTAYNRELLPGLKRNVYGASMRMRVTDDDWADKPGKSSYNPNGVKERSISRAKVMEFGPVTFPANPAATAMARSATDWFYDSLRSRFPASFDEALRRVGGALPQAVAETYALDGFTSEAALDAVLDTDLTGRSDTWSVDGGDFGTESSSDRGSTYVDEFSERIDHLRFREIKMRHASAYEREPK